MAKAIEDRNLRKKATHSQKMRRIGPELKNLSRPHKRGAPVSKAEKEMVLYMFDQQMGNPQCVEIQEFFCFSDFTCNQLWRMKKLKNAIFTISGALNL